MNEHDRMALFHEMFLILKPRIDEWTLFEVLSFMVIIRSPFSDMVRKGRIDGRQLCDLKKTEKLFNGYLTANNILPYLKMLIIVEYIRSYSQFVEPQPLPLSKNISQGQQVRPRPRSIFIAYKLLKTLQSCMERVSTKPLVLWTVEQVLELLRYLKFHKLFPIVERLKADGFILLYVMTDWDCLLRLRQYIQDVYLQELSLLAQLMLAESYYQRFFHDEDDSPRVSTDFKPEIRKISVSKNSQDNFEDENLNMLKNSIERKLEEYNDFFLAIGELGHSVKDYSETGEEYFMLGRVKSDKHPVVEKEEFGKNFSMSGGTMYKPLTNVNGIVYTESSQDGELLAYKQLYPIMFDDYKDELRQSLPNSEYPASYRLAESYIPDENLLEQSVYPEGQLQESYIVGNTQNSSMAQSIIGNNVNEQKLFISSIEYYSRLNYLKKASLSLPFDLLSFYSLHMISLVELSEHSKEYIDRQDYRRRSFCLKGVRFGRDKENYYSYPDELSISSRHALVLFRDEGFYLQDQGSKTGTYKQLISRTQLQEDMYIQLSHVIEFKIETISKRGDEGLIKIVFIRPDSMPTYQAYIKNNVRFTMGRNYKCNIPFDSKKTSVSVKHAEILYEDGKFYFIDCSQNGSWLRLSQKGEKSEPVLLHKGDRFRLSSKKVFMVEDIRTPGRLY